MYIVLGTIELPQSRVRRDSIQSYIRNGRRDPQRLEHLDTLDLRVQSQFQQHRPKQNRQKEVLGKDTILGQQLQNHFRQNSVDYRPNLPTRLRQTA